MGHTGEGVPLLLSPRRVDAVLVSRPCTLLSAVQL